MKSLGFCGLRPCSWRVQASKEDACATISTLFPTKSEEHRRQRQRRTDDTVHLHRPNRLGRASLTSVLAVCQDVFGHLVAPAHVVLVRLGHGELADGDQRSVETRNTSITQSCSTAAA